MRSNSSPQALILLRGRPPSFVPAGAVLGVRIIEIGRNPTATVTPAIALSMVF
jgi:hypothetical protein